MGVLSYSCGQGARAVRGVIFGCLLVSLLFGGGTAIPQTPAGSSGSAGNSAPDPFFKAVIANQEKGERELDVFERTQRQEVRRPGGDANVIDIKTFRLFPMGTGSFKLPMMLEGKAITPEVYREELEKLEKYLVWVAQDGSSQKEAYAKAERKRKDRFDLLEATYQAFIFTQDGGESRNGRTLLRYNITPNPNYRPTTRNATLFTRVRGIIWVDQQSSQLAKIEGTVTDDISIGLFLAKVYKGSHFMQERYEVAPGVWQATFEQYDFDGRKFLSSFSIHERTFYSGYKRVGPPTESVGVVRAELNKIGAEAARQ
jgi:hypothetical protein